ncbi:cupin domain-containing protein [Methyloversatilis sp. XJ19-13]|uniref:cupin domain-containing protein n=1 Tax=Methyloversatilis sp. XJ19-13 TaxID=2963430 RepID=UPI00211D03BC|nr:cupin domain-containing protein [Methyloversatilis sp. XJ19-13]MCQ9376114.1 cupin domain-containing protein [Methyloversatilis sp. XJ19-13]
MDKTLLGGLSPRTFLRDHWQKKPLLVRGAIPGFNGLLSRDALFDLARDEDVESRFIAHDAAGWQLERGPLPKHLLKRPKSKPWTVLVQGLNLLLPQADALMRRFAFIPYARLDDVMVSYATGGGGVGPHFDSYDVFLLQGSGRRRWQISAQKDLTLVDGAPLRILRDFVPEQEWLLEPGDLLYLPPHYAHNGVAEGECTTYSIGFRAPSAQELGTAFLDHLRDRLCLDGMYADPDLALQDDPARLPPAMIDHVADMLGAIRWSRSDVEQFLGSYLSEPKQHVFFDPPDDTLSLKRFAQKVSKHGVRLDTRTQLLRSGRHVWINGEAVDVPQGSTETLAALARDRLLAVVPDHAGTLALLHDWYGDGFLYPGADGD